jgi:hypothetical protein
LKQHSAAHPIDLIHYAYVMALSDDGKMVDKKEAPSAWKQMPAAAVEEDLGEEWPLLPGAAAKKAPSSSAAPVAQVSPPFS